MTMTLAELPPPIVLQHDETLHAIHLPPLATFLSGLHRPEHLLKLNDILDRYRTPKSYHRIDVRLVESSEIPQGAERGEWLASLSDTERGEPVILTREVLEEADALMASDEQVQDMTNGRDTSESVLTPPPTAAPVDVNGDARSSEVPNPTSPRGRPSPSPAMEIDPSLLLLDPPASLDPPIHPAPPAAPKRRLRELRVDIRTLDPAALYSLETWRREVLGLDKLNMEHPASIWYKEPTPPPPPSPPVPPLTQPADAEKRRRGRPSKRRRIEHEGVVQVEEDTGDTVEGGANGSGDANGGGHASASGDANAGVEVPTSDGDALNGEPQESYSALVEALHDSGVIEAGSPPREPDMPVSETLVVAVTDSDVLKAIESVDSLPADMVMETSTPTVDPSSPSPPSKTQTAPVSTGPVSRVALSPSPDIILNDAFDMDESADPDFVPIVRPAREGPLRRRKTGQAVLNDRPQPQPEVGTWTNPIPIKHFPRGMRCGARSFAASALHEVSPSEFVAVSRGLGTRTRARLSAESSARGVSSSPPRASARDMGSRSRTRTSTESMAREVSAGASPVKAARGGRPRQSEPVRSGVREPAGEPIVILDEDEIVALAPPGPKGRPRKSDPGPRGQPRVKTTQQRQRMLLEAVELPTLAEAMDALRATAKKEAKAFLVPDATDVLLAEWEDVGGHRITVDMESDTPEDEWDFLRGL